MQMPLEVAVLADGLLAKCRSEADLYFSHETGGVFMGYRIRNQLIITGSIGGGPSALRGPHSFEPHHRWQNDRIAEHYEQSGRRETYLGDWHSHPRAASGALSRQDRAVIRKIAGTPAARAATPIMAIFFGTPGCWQLTIWTGRLSPGLFGLRRLKIAELKIRNR